MAKKLMQKTALNASHYDQLKASLAALDDVAGLIPMMQADGTDVGEINQLHDGARAAVNDRLQRHFPQGRPKT